MSDQSNEQDPPKIPPPPPAPAPPKPGPQPKPDSGAAPAEHLPPGAGEGGRTSQPSGSTNGRLFATLAHVLAIFFFLLGPLVIWLVKREEDDFIDDQGREAINWELTAMIAWFISIPVGWVIGVGFLGPWIYLAKIVLNVVAAVRANEGQRFRYPFALRLLR